MRYAARKMVGGQYGILVPAANPVHPGYGLSKNAVTRACKGRQLVIDTWGRVLRGEEDVAMSGTEFLGGIVCLMLAGDMAGLGGGGAGAW